MEAAYSTKDSSLAEAEEAIISENIEQFQQSKEFQEIISIFPNAVIKNSKDLD